MPEIEIEVKRKIYDDPDFCSELDNFDSRSKCCPYLFWQNDECKLFNHGLLLAGTRTYFKCDQCKAAYQKTKQQQKKELDQCQKT
jgi:hypothetical protein